MKLAIEIEMDVVDKKNTTKELIELKAELNKMFPSHNVKISKAYTHNGSVIKQHLY